MPYFTRAELADLPDVDGGRFSDEQLDAAHDWIAGIIERECDTSFVHRTVIERLSGDGSNMLMLSDPYVVAVTAVTVGGVAYDAAALAGLFVEHGMLWQPAGSHWARGVRGSITVTYTAGYSEEPPLDLKAAAMRAARNWLLTNDKWASSIDSRATSINNDFGNINLSVASADGRPTGLPEVDATITAWARRVRVPKVS